MTRFHRPQVNVEYVLTSSSYKLFARIDANTTKLNQPRRSHSSKVPESNRYIRHGQTVTHAIARHSQKSLLIDIMIPCQIKSSNSSIQRAGNNGSSTLNKNYSSNTRSMFTEGSKAERIRGFP